MKIFDEINYMQKYFVHEYYSNIIYDFKDYEKISRTKMINEIFDFYKDYNNIIELCTVRELKVLEMLLNDEEEYKDDKYKWELKTLHKKFLSMYSSGKNCVIPDEFKDFVSEALKNVDWEKAKKLDHINEILIGYCKTRVKIKFYSLINFGSLFLDMSEEEIYIHVINNNLFRFYTYKIFENICGYDEEIPFIIYEEYLDILDELNDSFDKFEYVLNDNYDLDEYKILFYNDFNVNKLTVKKLVDELKTDIYSLSWIEDDIIKCVILNSDRDVLIKSIESKRWLKDKNLNEFFIIMNKAMDDMPSAALCGLSLNDYKAKIDKSEKILLEKNKNYTKQENARLDPKETSEFYRLYFALLDYTNRVYKVIPGYKIHKQINLNPEYIMDVIDKLWEDIEKNIDDFCKDNIFRFNKDELVTVNEFKNGVKSHFVLVAFEKEYTAFNYDDKTLMVKGLTANIDEIISINQIPTFIETTLLPFKGKIIFDGLFKLPSIVMGPGFYKVCQNEYKKNIKYYHF